MDLVNFSPFSAQLFPGVDAQRREYVAVVVSAAFEARPKQPLSVVEVQPEVHAADVHYGDPKTTSVRYEAQFAPEKERVDVLVVGHAKAPPGYTARGLLLQLRVAEIHKELQVVGNRASALSKPAPFDHMPVVYERAYGGVHAKNGKLHLENPVGIGYAGAAGVIDPALGTVLPNVFYPNREQTTAGFGAVGRGWQPRLSLAGTYDKAWLDNEWPLLPKDFQIAHFQAAPRDQQSERIVGGEQVELHNMTPEGVWRFQLPTLDVPLRAWSAAGGREYALRLDTVLLEPDDYKVTLTARAKLLVRRGEPPLQEAIIGHVKQGWWRARESGRPYYDPRAAGGGAPQRGYR